MPVYATDRYIRKFRARTEKRGPLAKMGTTKARVNLGRWLADCPNCNGAALVQPGVEMVCGGLFANLADPDKPFPCQAVYQVVFPDAETMAEINRLLDARPPDNQNWTDEDVFVLLGENIAAGLES